jgi:hypothetical protein
LPQVPEPKQQEPEMRLNAPGADVGARAALLRARAATASPPGPRASHRWFALAGPEGNKFCVAMDPDR